MSENIAPRLEPELENLLSAVREGDLETVDRSLANGADINALEVENFLNIPLIAGVKSGNLDMVRHLLVAGACVDRQYSPTPLSGFTPLSEAALDQKAPKMVTILLKYGANPKTALYDSSVLTHCCYSVLESKGRGLLIDHVYVPIDDASYEIAGLLLEAGASPNGERNGSPAAPLEGPVMANDLRTIQLLIDQGAKLTSAAIFNAACYSAYEGNVEALELLLENGWKPHPKKIKDRAPASPLNYAVARGHLKIIDLLIRYKIELDYVATESLSTGNLRASVKGCCVNLAIIKGHHDALRLLLESGANPAGGLPPDEDRIGIHPNPLTLTSYLGDVIAIELLLRYGADINEQSGGVYGEYISCSRRTPLQVAIESGNTAAAEFLQGRGAKP